MKRFLIIIDRHKWYHLETIKKYYGSDPRNGQTYLDRNGKPAHTVTFNQGRFGFEYLIHPKTKRIRYYSNQALLDAGYNP